MRSALPALGYHYSSVLRLECFTRLERMISINGLFGSLEREESRGEKSSGEESRGEWFPPLCLDVFKISKGEGSN